MKDEIKELENKCIRYMVERDRARGENEVLKERKNKAIEYIIHYLKDIDNLDSVMVNSIILKETLNILKGEDKDD